MASQGPHGSTLERGLEHLGSGRHRRGAATPGRSPILGDVPSDLGRADLGRDLRPNRLREQRVGRWHHSLDPADLSAPCGDPHDHAIRLAPVEPRLPR